jgi:hypothetical protein
LVLGSGVPLYLAECPGGPPASLSTRGANAPSAYPTSLSSALKASSPPRRNGHPFRPPASARLSLSLSLLAESPPAMNNLLTVSASLPPYTLSPPPPGRLGRSPGSGARARDLGRTGRRCSLLPHSCRRPSQGLVRVIGGSRGGAIGGGRDCVSRASAECGAGAGRNQPPGFSATCGRLPACRVVALDLRGFGSGAAGLRRKQNGLSSASGCLFSASLGCVGVEMFSLSPPCPAATIYLNAQLH